MIKKDIISNLYLYNAHIGHYGNYNSKLGFYILGKRYNFAIIDLNKSFLLLKKALFLVKNLSLNNSTLLFHYSKYMNLNIIYKCVLISIIKHSGQQIIRYDWKYGYIGNFFFSFYLLIKDITKSWFKHQNYLFNFEKKKNLYYSFDIEGEKLGYFEYLFLNESNVHISKKHEQQYKKYSKWYEKWIKNQKNFEFWKLKKNSLRYNNFLKQLCLNDINNIIKKKNVLNFKYLFLKLFYYIYLKKEDPFLLQMNVEKINLLDHDYIHNQFIFYWRFILYFKYFNNYYQLPDALFSIFPDNNEMPVNEYTSSSCISIALVDTVTNFDNVHYPIISNDDSLLIVFFYFSLFSNVFIENKLNLYNYFKKNIKKA